MSSSLNVSLTDELRSFVDSRASDSDVYSTPSEYVRDLIRRDMEARKKEGEREIAGMLAEARTSPRQPMEAGFFDRQRARLNARETARTKKS